MSYTGARVPLDAVPMSKTDQDATLAGGVLETRGFAARVQRDPSVAVDHALRIAVRTHQHYFTADSVFRATMTVPRCWDVLDTEGRCQHLFPSRLRTAASKHIVALWARGVPPTTFEVPYVWSRFTFALRDLESRLPTVVGGPDGATRVLVNAFWNKYNSALFARWTAEGKPVHWMVSMDVMDPEGQFRSAVNTSAAGPSPQSLHRPPPSRREETPPEERRDASPAVRNEIPTNITSEDHYEHEFCEWLRAYLMHADAVSPLLITLKTLQCRLFKAKYGVPGMRLDLLNYVDQVVAMYRSIGAR